jgi:hypothetical protein
MKIIQGDFSGKGKKGKSGNRPDLVLNRPSGEPKYSEMLIALMKPHLDDVPDPDDVEDIIELAIVAWNMAITTVNLGLAVPNPFIETALAESEIKGDAKEIVYTIIKAKNEKYPTSNEIIQDYEFVDDGDGMYNLKLKTQPLDNFLENMDVDEDDDDDDADSMDELQYEEGLVNRSALLVQPTPAFWSFLQQHDATFTIPQMPSEATVYLIPEFFSPKELDKWLKKNFDKIFVNELEEWTYDNDAWPAKRTYKLFKEYFTVAGHEMVMDLEAGPVLK